MIIATKHHRPKGRTPNYEQGFSLLELLLSIAVFSILMTGVFNLIQTFAEREIARASDKYMNTIKLAMDQILDDFENFNALYVAARDSAGGGYQLIADADAGPQDNIMKNFQVGPTWIQGSRLFNNQFRENSPLRTPIRILLRIADNPAIETDTRAMEVLMVSALPRPDGYVRGTANEGEFAGGYIRTYTSKATAVMQSAYGGWQVTPSNGLAGTSWYRDELQASLDSNVDGSYLVYYTFANLEDKTGDYLYRIDDTIDPNKSRNTMYAPLNMGGNDVIGADNVGIGTGGSGASFALGDPTIPDECEGGVLCVNGPAVMKGSASISGTMITRGSALIDESANINNVRIQNALTDAQRETYGAQGLFVVDGNGNDGGGTQDRVNVTGNATILDGSIAQSGNLDDITATDVAMPSDGILTTGNIRATRRISATDIAARTLLVNDQLKAGIVQDGSLNVANPGGGGIIGVVDIRDAQNLVYGQAGGGTRTLNAPKVNVETLNIGTFGNCADGCGN